MNLRKFGAMASGLSLAIGCHLSVAEPSWPSPDTSQMQIDGGAADLDSGSSDAAEANADASGDDAGADSGPDAAPCTLMGTVTFSSPLIHAARLQVATFSPPDPTADGGMFARLSDGFSTVTDGTRTRYPYELHESAPGGAPTAALTSLDGGLGMNFVMTLSQTACDAGQVCPQDISFGDVVASGTATLKPPFVSSSPIEGVVAARSIQLSTLGIVARIVLMPTTFVTVQGNLEGNFEAIGLPEGAQFDVLVFTSFDSEDPSTAALVWALNPFAPEMPQATFTAQRPSVTVEFTADLRVRFDGGL